MSSLSRTQAAREQADFDTERLDEFTNAPRVLLRENLGGGHEHRLSLALHRQHHGKDRDRRLPRTDISLKHPVHTSIRLHVRVDLAKCPRLGTRQSVRKGLVKGADQFVRALEYDTGLELRRRSPGLRLHELQEKEFIIRQPPAPAFSIKDALRRM